jgi:hypothetical protein
MHSTYFVPDTGKWQNSERIEVPVALDVVVRARVYMLPCTLHSG